jgi:hypothetical protein
MIQQDPNPDIHGGLQPLQRFPDLDHTAQKSILGAVADGNFEWDLLSFVSNHEPQVIS